jgi:hypothetical protein
VGREVQTALFAAQSLLNDSRPINATVTRGVKRWLKAAPIATGDSLIRYPNKPRRQDWRARRYSAIFEMRMEAPCCYWTGLTHPETTNEQRQATVRESSI